MEEEGVNEEGVQEQDVQEEDVQEENVQEQDVNEEHEKTYIGTFPLRITNILSIATAA